MRCAWLRLALPTLLLAECALDRDKCPRSMETGAIRWIKTLHEAQAVYRTQFGRYADTLAELGPPEAGRSPSALAADLIPSSLASGDKDGYIFTLAANGDAYSIHAWPKIFSKTGRRSFYSDQTMLIRANSRPDLATARSPELR